MKRINLILFFIASNLIIYSQVPSSVLSVSQSGNSLIVTFNLPSYALKDTSINDPYGVSEIFKYVDIDYFGIIDDIGYPQLPQLTVDFNVPVGASNFQVATSNKVIQNTTINRRFLPTQDDYEEEPNFQINSSYYSSNGSTYNFLSQVSEPYLVFGAQGISFSIFPFTYNPQLNKLTVLKQATFTITYTTSTLKSTQADYSSPIKDSYLSEFFENYSYLKSGSDFSGRYLMITDPDYEDALTYFANYKRNIGYDVTVVNTTTTGTTSGDIKNYIQTQYNNSATRPDFILLVGDHSDIPASGGNSSGDDKDDPITDLNYAKLAGDDYFADVFLGRFSVTRNSELQNIINKTIYMEMNIHLFDKKAKFLAGEEDNGWMENQFENGHDKVVKKTFEPEGFDCEKLYQPSTTDAVDALSDNPLFYIYSGHGKFTYMDGGSFSIYSSDVSSATNTVYPMVFSFACKTGNFAYSSTNIGESWLREEDGGSIAYFGSSVITYVNSDKAIEKEIFGDPFIENERIGCVINLGMKGYWKRFWSFWNRKRTKRYMKAYNLLGDPSFNFLGTGCISNFTFTNNEVFTDGAEITYHAENAIENEADFEIQNGANVTLLAGNSITLNPGFKVEKGATFEARIEPCDNGSTLKSAKISDNDIVEHSVRTKIIDQEKIITPSVFSIFPNPTNSEFSVSYTLNEESSVKLELYDLSGMKIKTLLIDEKQTKGNYYFNFSIPDLAAGTYLFVFTNSLKTITSKIIKN
jgi:hypothetical protein